MKFVMYVGRRQWVMHDSVQYDPIQGQGHDSRALQSWKSGRFHKLSPPPFTMGAGNWPQILNYGTISKLDLAGFVIFGLVLCHLTLKLAETSVLELTVSPKLG